MRAVSPSIGSNIQHPTSNIQHPKRPPAGHSMLDVGCWMLDVLSQDCPCLVFLVTSPVAFRAVLWLALLVLSHRQTALAIQFESFQQPARRLRGNRQFLTLLGWPFLFPGLRFRRTALPVVLFVVVARRTRRHERLGDLPFELLQFFAKFAFARQQAH